MIEMPREDVPKSRDELIRELLADCDEELERLPDETDEEYEQRLDKVLGDPELQALMLLALVAPIEADSGKQAGPPRVKPWWRFWSRT